MKNAKRILALVLILLLSVSLLCACGGNKENPSTSSEQVTSDSATVSGKETGGQSRPPVTLPPPGSVTAEPAPEVTDPVADENGDNFLGWIFE